MADDAAAGGDAALALTQAQLDAAHAFANTTVDALKVGTKAHPPTLVAAAARMAGTYLFRSFGLALAGVSPGQAVLSDAANDEWPRLIQLSGAALARMGIAVTPPSPGATERFKPALEFLETQRRIEPAFEPIRAMHALGARDAAMAAALATALLVRHSAKVLDPNVAFHIACAGFVEGAKTAPDPVDASVAP